MQLKFFKKWYECELWVINIKRKSMFNPFSTNVPILCSQETWENLWFSDVFRGYRIETLAKIYNYMFLFRIYLNVLIFPFEYLFWFWKVTRLYYFLIFYYYFGTFKTTYLFIYLPLYQWYKSILEEKTFPYQKK